MACWVKSVAWMPWNRPSSHPTSWACASRSSDSLPGPEQEVINKVEEQLVTDLLSVLDQRARYAVEQRFGLNDGRKRSYREVGEELGVTAEAARRLVKRAVSAVREQASEAAFDAA
jgi:RNA polymerase sigma factor (sigma-70 family)